MTSNKKYAPFRMYEKTRDKFKLLSALVKKPMIELVDELVSTKLAEVQEDQKGQNINEIGE